MLPQDLRVDSGVREKAKGLAIVVGAGSGLGVALLRRFQEGGYKAVGFVRSEVDSESNPEGCDIRQLDFTDAERAAAEMRMLMDEYGPPKIVVHNTAQLIINAFTETRLEDYEETWRAMVFSAVVLAQRVLQAMACADGGAILVSGAAASLRGGAKISAFSSVKFALCGLTQSLAREYQARGVHVAHFILDGIIDSARSRVLHLLAPASMMKPEDIAENYWYIAHQAKSAWSHEIDLHPHLENF